MDVNTISEAFDNLLRVNVLSSLSFSQTPGRHTLPCVYVLYQDDTVMCDDLAYYKLEDAGRVLKTTCGYAGFLSGTWGEWPRLGMFGIFGRDGHKPERS